MVFLCLELWKREGGGAESLNQRISVPLKSCGSVFASGNRWHCFSFICWSRLSFLLKWGSEGLIRGRMPWMSYDSSNTEGGRIETHVVLSLCCLLTWWSAHHHQHLSFNIVVLLSHDSPMTVDFVSSFSSKWQEPNVLQNCLMGIWNSLCARVLVWPSPLKQAHAQLTIFGWDIRDIMRNFQIRG